MIAVDRTIYVTQYSEGPYEIVLVRTSNAKNTWYEIFINNESQNGIFDSFNEAFEYMINNY